MEVVSWQYFLGSYQNLTLIPGETEELVNTILKDSKCLFQNHVKID